MGNPHTPEELRPVLALIEGHNSLHFYQWHEVVYHDGAQWKSFAGSKTFDDGEQVLRWIYPDDVLPKDGADV